VKKTDSEKRQNKKRTGLLREDTDMPEFGEFGRPFEVLLERRKEFTDSFRNYSLHLIEAAQAIDREYKEVIQQKNLSCESSDRCYVFPSLRIRKDEGYLSVTWRKITRPYYYVKDFKGAKNSLWSYAVKLGDSEEEIVKAFKKYVPDWALPIVLQTEKDFERLLLEYKAYSEIRRKIRVFDRTFKISPEPELRKKSVRKKTESYDDIPPVEEEYEDEWDDFMNPES